MRHFALIGHSLTHSQSASLFYEQHFPDADYRLVSMPSLKGLRQWVEQESISGFNVTIPYKQEVIPYLDALSPEAETINAVNCVVLENGKLIGHNTDAPAFQQTLVSAHWPLADNAFILGTGGAAQAVAYALRQLGIHYTMVSRNPDVHPGSISYSDVTFPSSHFTLIINATPVGMYPNIDQTPLCLSSCSSPCPYLFVYDLIYNPSPTRLLQEAAALHAQTKNGLEMLRLQAQLSWRLWHLN